MVTFRRYFKGVLLILIFWFVIWIQRSCEIVTVPEGMTQMSPAVKPLKILFLDQRIGSAGDFKTGQIVYYQFGLGKEKQVYVSRVIGVQGDKISLIRGVLKRNGEAVNESYLPQQFMDVDLLEVSVPREHIFVLNDDRTNTKDSRSFGPVHWRCVTGLVKR